MECTINFEQGFHDFGFVRQGGFAISFDVNNASPNGDLRVHRQLSKGDALTIAFLARLGPHQATNIFSEEGQSLMLKFLAVAWSVVKALQLLVPFVYVLNDPRVLREKSRITKTLGFLGSR